MTYIEKMRLRIAENDQIIICVLIFLVTLYAFFVGKARSDHRVEELERQNDKLAWQIATIEKENANLLDLLGKYETKFKQIVEILSFKSL